MAKFNSLLFRELRIYRKNIILISVFLIVFGLFLAVAISVARLDPEFNEKIDVISLIVTASLSIGAVAILLGNMHTDILKSDINTNWLTYSYTLPIEPKDRAFITLIGRCGLTLLLMAAGLGFTSVYCAVVEIPFSASFVSVYAIIFTVATLYNIVSDRFILRSRSIAELTGSMRRLELGTLGVIIIIGAIFFGKIKHFLFSDDVIPLRKLFDKLNGRMLIWLIPLCIVLLFADYFVIKSSMQSAYSADKDNTKAQIREKETLSDTHDYPTGFLYKELKQNRLFIILTALIPFILLVFNYMILYVTAATDENKPAFSDVLTDSENTIVRFLMIAVGAYVASSMFAGIFGGDDRKLYAYFTVSTPQGVRGSLYYKYVLAFAMNGLFMVSSIFAGSIYDTLYYAITGKENTSLNTLYIAIFFLLLTICAWDIPFMIRFGQKKGSYIKTALMLGISTILVVTFDYLPDPIKDEVMKLFSAVMGGEISDNMMLGISFVPILCAAAFYLSYKFSCKLFMRGVDGYDK